MSMEYVSSHEPLLLSDSFQSRVRFIHRCLKFLMCECVCFTFIHYFLLVYKNTINFCTLALYLVTLKNLIVDSNRWDSFESSAYKIMLFVVIILHFLCSVCMLFITYSCLIALARTSRTMLIGMVMVSSEYLYIVSDFWGKALIVFHKYFAAILYQIKDILFFF